MKHSVIKMLNPERWLLTYEDGSFKYVDEVSEEDYKLWEQREKEVLDMAKAILED